MPENCLLITVDSLRADHLSVFGYEANSTPMIDRLADDGISFERAFATGPGTSPSFPALLTGTMPLSYGGLGPLQDDRPSVSESLGDAGLATAGIHSNPFLSSHFNYDRGFDYFEDYQNRLMGVATRLFPRGIELNDSLLGQVDDVVHLTDFVKKAYQLVKGKPRPYVSAEVITDDVIEWLSETGDPFFCWAHYMDVHHPCFPPQEFRAQYDVEGVSQSTVHEWYSRFVQDSDPLPAEAISKLHRLYDAAIEYTDGQVGRIVEFLREDGRYEDTLVIFTSDHGELFGEYDQYGKQFRMYDELLHVPLVVANGPASLRGAREQLVSLLDVPPLVHHALGLDAPSAYEGRRPGIDTPRAHVLAEHEVDGEIVVGARSDRWLYEGDEIEGERRLYNISDGNFERVPVDGANREAQRLEEMVLARLERLDAAPHSLEDTVDDDVRDRLEELGYL